MDKTFYTDYPFESLGDEPHKLAPIREVQVLRYDGNKYCVVLIDGFLMEDIKIGYLYSLPGRFGEVPSITSKDLHDEL